MGYISLIHFITCEFATRVDTTETAKEFLNPLAGAIKSALVGAESSFALI